MIPSLQENLNRKLYYFSGVKLIRIPLGKDFLNNNMCQEISDPTELEF